MARAKLNSGKFYVYLDSQKYWECLETGRSIDDLYPDHFKTEIVDIQYDNYLKSILLPGEEYVLLDDLSYDYAVTSFGRVINCHSKKTVSVYISGEDAKTSIRNQKMKLSELFKNNGWKFDVNIIKKHYVKNKWNSRSI
jgi:hypothetical protein